jgi:Holliday junction resolvase RusA-like endonuclease
MRSPVVIGVDPGAQGAIVTPYRVTIPGDPRGKGSVRVARWGAYKDEATEEYMGRAIFAMRAAPHGAPIDRPWTCSITCLVRRPKALIPKARARTPQPDAGPFPAPCKPDLDNVAKCILDSLVQAGIVADDRACVRLSMWKLYVAVGDSPRVEVVVE